MNSVTHGVGCLLGIAGLVLLIVFAALRGGGRPDMAAAIVYGCQHYPRIPSFYALPRDSARARQARFRIIDHSCIYLLIAGSYTPVLPASRSRNDGGAVLFFAVWAIAIIGIALECLMRERHPHWVSGLVYLLMGGSSRLLRLPESVALLNPVALALLAIGGVSTPRACRFYIAKNVRYLLHSVFHLWVLAGSIFQFMAVILS